MKLIEFAELSQSEIEAKSAYNGKILCKRFNKGKHTDIGNREISAIWSEIRVRNGHGYSSYATPIFCVYVDGMPELDKHMKEKGKILNG